MKKEHQRDKKNYIILLCVIACISIILIFIAGISYLNNLIYKNTLKNIEEIAVHDVKNINTILDMSWKSLDYLGNNIQQKDFSDMNELQDYLKDKCEISRFSMLGVIDSKGNIYTSTGQINTLNSKTQENQFLNGDIQKFAERYDSYSNQSSQNEYSMLYAVRTQSLTINEVRIIGVVAQSPLSDIESTIMANNSDSQMYSIVFDNDGDMVANLMRNDAQDMRENFYTRMEAASLSKGYTVEKLKSYNLDRKSYRMRYTDSNHIDKIIYATPVENTSWTFAIIVPYDVFTEQNIRLIFTNIVMLSLLTLMLIAMIICMYFIIRASMKLQLEAKAKSDFLSNMSHEIRTPLNGIIGLNHLMNMHIDDKAKIQEYLKKSNATAEYLLSLINDILDMSKLQADSMEIITEPFSLVMLADSLYSMQKENFHKRGINFYMDNQITYPYIMGDEMKLKQVLMNILSNAAKFTPKDGDVNFILSQIPEGKSISTVIKISDTGCGMTKEFQEKIFDSFSQERNKNSNTVKGTGLGMFISSLIMEKMGGSISVESQLNVGSTFTVQFPAQVVQEAQEVQEIQEHPKMTYNPKGSKQTNMNILLAEDNALNAEILTEILGNEGFSVTHAENGRKAVDLFADSSMNTFDVILMDVQMPVMDGYEACKAIRSMDRADAETVLIFACTANAFIEDKRKATEAGMNDFLVKPVDVNLLLEKLNLSDA